MKISIGDISALNNNRIELNFLQSICGNKSFKGKDVQFESDGNYTWYGELEYSSSKSCDCHIGYLLLISKNGEKFGQLKLEDDFYTIEDIGGKNVLVKELSPVENINSCGAYNAPAGIIEETIIQKRTSGNCDIKILVLYTAAANARVSNIQNIATSSVSITNQALRNSNISNCELNFQIAGIEEININETSKSFDDVLDIVSSNSTAHTLRDFHQADVVVLLVDKRIMQNEGTLGIAFLGPINSLPYAVITSTGANNGFVFSHEIGHILGARHEPCNAQDAGSNCNNNTGIAHAHSWSFNSGCLFWKKTNKRKTIMFSTSNPSEAIPNFSNPSVKVENISTGVVGERDNARRLKDNACTIANFRTGDDFLSVRIDGQSKMCENDNACLVANISGNPGPYTYEWKFNATGTNWNNTPIASTNNYFCFSTPNPSYALGDVIHFSLKVISSNGEITDTYHSIEVVQEGYNGMLCARSIENPNIEIKFNINPNPTSEKLNLEYSLSQKSTSWIEVFDVNGNKVIIKNQGVLEKGNFSISIDLSELQAGVYFIQHRTLNTIQRHSFIKI